MRIFSTLAILVFFIPLEAGSVTLIKLRSGTEGSSKVEFHLDEKKSTLEKTSNFFDTKKNYNLGKFTVPVHKTEGPIKSLNSLVIKLAQTKTEDPIKPHEAFFILDGKKVGQDSPMYKTLGKVFAELQALPWVLEEGVSFSSDLKTKSVVKDTKVFAKENFNFKFYCKDQSQPTYCLDKDYGILYVE
jgi:hypothetical protein